MFEIRIHSRGGQGGVTAAKLIAQAAFHDGRFATAFPFYGAERRGAPVVSFVRISDEPIKVYSQVRSPDMVIVLDASVMDVIDVFAGLREGGAVLINTTEPLAIEGHPVHPVDLTGIALRVNLVVAGSPILNTPVLGALARIGLVSREAALAAIAETFDDPRNVEAAKAAYEETRP
ncbi:MAG TPA: 2-oxoacid:acceptor oxidoreductase family protein [Methanoregulaceae archaeon]|nr:2-oxoacid:acceptor oxidoreductase family protein [Methanoregulaceae archaeon]HOV67209.1 2-oxoacid:acceptor oxidoreductase family protein [Methanoregulaceae archaeon]HQJ88838.1 2-oxoacid:acceptor oxidoreductase family protein [Methanoregulaceae archaeon]